MSIETLTAIVSHGLTYKQAKAICCLHPKTFRAMCQNHGVYLPGQQDWTGTESRRTGISTQTLRRRYQSGLRGVSLTAPAMSRQEAIQRANAAQEGRA